MNQWKDKTEIERKEASLLAWAECLKIKVNSCEENCLYGEWNQKSAVIAFEWMPNDAKNCEVFFLIEEREKQQDKKSIQQASCGKMVVLLTEKDRYRLWPGRETGEQIQTKAETQGWGAGGFCGIAMLFLAILENHWGYFVAGVFCLAFYQANL